MSQHQGNDDVFDPHTTDDASAEDAANAQQHQDPKRQKKGQGKIESLEQRILLSATWVDADALDALAGGDGAADADVDGVDDTLSELDHPNTGLISSTDDGGDDGQDASQDLLDGLGDSDSDLFGDSDDGSSAHGDLLDHSIDGTDDISGTELTGDHSVDGFSGSETFVVGDRAFKIEVQGEGSIDWSYDADDGTLHITDVDGTNDHTVIDISSLGDQDVAVNDITLDTDVGSLVSNVDLGTLHVTGDADVGSISVRAGEGLIENLGFDRGLDTDLTIDADVDHLQLAEDLDADLHVTGHVSTAEISGRVSGNGLIDIDGGVDELNALQGIHGGQVDITGDLGSLNAAGVDAQIHVSGSVGEININAGDSGDDLGGTLEVGGNLGRLNVSDDLNADVTVHGDVTQIEIGDDVSDGASLNCHGGVETLNIGGTLDGEVQVDGAADAIHVGDQFSANLSVDGDVHSFDAGSIADGAVLNINGNLETFQSAKGMLGGTVHVTGNVGSVSTGQLDGTFKVDGNVDSLHVHGAAEGTVAVAGNLSSFTVDKHFDGVLTADQVNGKFEIINGDVEHHEEFERAATVRYDGSTDTLVFEMAADPEEVEWIQSLSYNDFDELSADQVVHLTPEQIATIPSSWWFSQISEDARAELTSEQIQAIDTSSISIKYLADDQVGELTTDQVQQLGYSDFRYLQPSQVSDLTAEQISTISSSWWFSQMSDDARAELTSEQIQALDTSSVSIKYLADDQVGELTTDQVQQLGYSDFRYLQPSQVSDLTAEQISTISSSWWFSQMSDDARAELTSEQVQAIDTSSISIKYLADDQVGELTTDQVQQLGYSDFRYLQPSQVSDLTAEQISTISSSWWFSQMSDDARAELTSEQVQALDTSSVSIGYLTTAQREYLTTEQVQDLSYSQFRYLPASRVPELTVEQISTIPSASEFNKLSDEAKDALLPEQIRALGEQVSGVTIVGSDADDVLTGNDNVNNIIGGAGNDQLDGGELNDVLDGGAGDDVLTGGAGRDYLIGGGGNDQMSGGEGDDTFAFENARAGDTYTVEGGEGGDTLDLREYSSDQVTIGQGRVVVELDDGGSFTINHTNVEAIELADGVMAAVPEVEWALAEPEDLVVDEFSTVTLGVSIEGAADSSSYDFDDGNLDEWNTTRGDWEVVDGELHDTRDGENRIWLDEAAGDNFEVHLTARIEDGNGFGIWMAEDTDSVSGYSVQYDPGYGSGKLLLRRWDNNSESVIAAVDFDGDWHSVERDFTVRVEDNVFTLEIDGETYFEIEHGEFGHSQVGLRTWHQTELYVDEFTVTSLDGVNESELQYSWTQTGGPQVELSDANAAHPDFDAPDVREPTTLTFEVTVSDGQHTSVETIEVTVNPVGVNADAGSDQVVEETSLVTLDATGSAYPGDAGEAQNLLVSSGFEDGLSDDAGNGWNAYDGRNIQIVSADEFPTVSGQDAAFVTMADGESGQQLIQKVSGLEPGQEYQFSGNINFQELDTKAWVGAGYQISMAESKYGSPSAMYVQDHPTDGWQEVTLTATADENGELWIRSWFYAVDEGNGYLDDFQLVAVDGEPDTSEFTYTWEQVGGPTVELSDVNAAQPTFQAPDVTEPTELTFEVTVSDGQHVSTDTVTIMVAGDNDAPTIDAGIETLDGAELDTTGVLNFAGGNTTDYVSLPASIFDGLEDFTIEMQVTRDADGDGVQAILSLANDDTNWANEFLVHTDSQGRITAYLKGQNLGHTGSVLEAGVEHDLTVAREGTSLRIFVDGEFEHEFRCSDSALEVDDGGAVLGQEQDKVGGGFAANQSFTGQIHGLRVSGTARYDNNYEVEQWEADADTRALYRPDMIGTDAWQDLAGPVGKLDATFHGDIADPGLPAVDEGTTLRLTADGVDPENQELAYTWQQTGGPTVELSDGGAATPTLQTPDVQEPTTLTFEVQVSDGANTHTDVVSFIVNPINHTPTARAGADLTVDASTSVMLDASASSDPDVEDSLTFNWRQTSGPQVQLDDVTASQPTFTSPDVREPTTLSFEVEVSDGDAVHTDVVEITVNPTGPAPVSFPYADDFSDGVADGFESVSGVWDVTDGAFEVSGLTRTGDNGVAVLEFDQPLPETFEVNVQLNSHSARGQYENGFVVFDYQGPNNFKFAGARVGANYWTVGHFDGSWHNDARLSERIDTDTAYGMNVDVDGGCVTLTVNGQQKVTYDFGESVNEGQVGLAADHAESHFDNLSVGVPDRAPEIDAGRRSPSEHRCRHSP